jgi:hypothetical protein
MDRNTSTAVLDRTRDRCADCGVRVPAGDVYCAKHE